MRRRERFALCLQRERYYLQTYCIVADIAMPLQFHFDLSSSGLNLEQRHTFAAECIIPTISRLLSSLSDSVR